MPREAGPAVPQNYHSVSRHQHLAFAVHLNGGETRRDLRLWSLRIVPERTCREHRVTEAGSPLPELGESQR